MVGLFTAPSVGIDGVKEEGKEEGKEDEEEERKKEKTESSGEFCGQRQDIG